MKQHEYKYHWYKVFKKSILLWFLILIQIGLCSFYIYSPLAFPFPELIIFNVILSALTIPGFILHINHLCRTRNTTFILKYESISLQRNTEITTLNSNDICKIILHEGPTKSRFPWYDYNWVEFIDTNGKSIAVSFYLLEISDFWMNTLSRRVNSKHFERNWNLFPLMKK